MDVEANNKRRRADSTEGPVRGGINEQRGRRGSDPRQDWRSTESMRGRGTWRGGRGGSSGTGMDVSRGRRGGGRGDMFAY
jgi:hypothetical protein